MEGHRGQEGINTEVVGEMRRVWRVPEGHRGMQKVQRDRHMICTKEKSQALKEKGQYYQPSSPCSLLWAGPFPSYTVLPNIKIVHQVWSVDVETISPSVVWRIGHWDIPGSVLKQRCLSRGIC